MVALVLVFVSLLHGLRGRSSSDIVNRVLGMIAYQCGLEVFVDAMACLLEPNFDCWVASQLVVRERCVRRSRGRAIIARYCSRLRLAVGLMYISGHAPLLWHMPTGIAFHVDLSRVGAGVDT